MITHDTDQHVEPLAKAFSARLLAAMGAENMQRVLDLNGVEPDREICHSYDFTDPNDAMLTAWQDVFGPEAVPAFIVRGSNPTEREDNARLVIVAQNIAKAQSFYFTAS